VQTVDVFTPCVDDPYLFGRIAAANSLSDVYAMGGRPITALSIVGFPIDDLAPEILESMLRGGMRRWRRRVAHSSADTVLMTRIKFGYAITGLIGAAQVVARQGARAGDALVLTKPLGTGMIAFAAQIGRIRAEAQAEAAASMAALNRDAAELMTRLGAHACTDVTGFGLAGHLLEMMRSSGTTAEIDLGALPVFAAVPECIRLDVVPGAIEKNQEYAGAWVRAEDAAAESNLCVFFDPQTSGGLLIALPEAEADAIVKELRERGHAGAARIGSVCESMPGSPPGTILVRETEFQNMHGTQGAILMSEKAESPTPSKQFASSVSSAQAAPELSPCCDHPPEAPGSTVPSPPQRQRRGRLQLEEEAERARRRTR
jgi:selenide,water dikinase